jgi:hypothetical protein
MEELFQVAFDEAVREMTESFSDVGLALLLDDDSIFDAFGDRVEGGSSVIDSIENEVVSAISSEKYLFTNMFEVEATSNSQNDGSRDCSDKGGFLHGPTSGTAGPCYSYMLGSNSECENLACDVSLGEPNVGELISADLSSIVKVRDQRKRLLGRDLTEREQTLPDILNASWGLLLKNVQVARCVRPTVLDMRTVWLIELKVMLLCHLCTFGAQTKPLYR